MEKDITIGEIVALDYRTAKIFKDAGIDFCCLSAEHEFAGGAMDRINVITSGYLVPPDGCNTYHVTFKLLTEFEDDLHTHVHLENNILFPKALITAN